MRGPERAVDLRLSKAAESGRLLDVQRLLLQGLAIDNQQLVLRSYVEHR